MDVLLIIIVACILCLKNAVEPASVEEEVLIRETQLNPSFYVDENAFMEVANALGFGTDMRSANSPDADMRTEPDDDIPIDTTHFIQFKMCGDSSGDEHIAHAGGSRTRRVDRMARTDN